MLVWSRHYYSWSFREHLLQKQNAVLPGLHKYVMFNKKSHFQVLFLMLLLPSFRNGVLFVLAWVVWVACLREWRANVSYVVHVLAWVTWVVYQRGWRGWRIKVSSVGDIGGNTRVVSQTISWVAHYFLSSFQKPAGNEYCSKLEKKFRFQVIYTSNISYFLEFPLGIWI